MSRAGVDINASYKFKYSSHTLDCVPIMSSNMDTVTNVETADVLAKHNWISVFPKHFNSIWAEGELPSVLSKANNYSLSCGTSDNDINLMVKVAKRIQLTFGN